MQNDDLTESGLIAVATLLGFIISATMFGTSGTVTPGRFAAYYAVGLLVVAVMNRASTRWFGGDVTLTTGWTIAAATCWPIWLAAVTGAAIGSILCAVADRHGIYSVGSFFSWILTGRK